MIQTYILPCKLPQEACDALNRESASIYAQVCVYHWRTYRKKGVWLSPFAAQKLNDFFRRGLPCGLHAHSVDAAQQGFYKACQTAKAARRAGAEGIRHPYRRKKYRTTIWKNTALRRHGNTLVLSNGRGNRRIKIDLPEPLREVLRFLEVRLVFDRKAGRYSWHIVAENGKQPTPPPGDNVVTADLGEVHPAVVGDEQEAVIITCRALRHAKQGHNKRLGQLRRALSSTKHGSRRHKRLCRTMARMKGKHKRVTQDLEHKVSRAIVKVAEERKAGTIVIGDVRRVADGVALSKQANQRVSQWSHGKVRQYVTYKAAAAGIQVVLQNEVYTSQTCPNCRARHKPKGRVYLCPSCGFQSHRDVVGQVNILSVYKYGSPGHIAVPREIKHRIPHDVRVMRRRRDTGQEAAVLAAPSVACRHLQEAASLQ